MICWFTADGSSVCCIQWRIFMHSSGWVCFCEYRAIFNWVSEIIRDCFGFAIAHFSVIGPEISRYPPNQSDTNYNQSWPGHKRFPALQAIYLFLLWFLIGWWWCTPFVWLVAGITLIWCFNVLLFSPLFGVSEGLKESTKVSILIDCLGVFIGLSLRSV